MEVANTLSYNDMEAITAVKSYALQAPGFSVIKHCLL